MRAYVVGSFALFAVAGLLVAGEKPAPKTSKATPALEKLKTLAGEWEAKQDDGSVVKVTYKIVSGGSGVLETLNPSEPVEMITVYHLDGDRVMLTHYCAMNNQPRMRSDGLSADGKRLVFKFVDITNLASPDEAHIHDLTVTFEDETHFTQEWTHYENGKAGEPTVFHFTRKK